MGNLGVEQSLAPELYPCSLQVTQQDACSVPTPSLHKTPSVCLACAGAFDGRIRVTIQNASYKRVWEHSHEAFWVGMPM
jgi:hypothetical protein